MSNLQRLLDLYRDSARTQQIVKALQTPTSTRLQIVGMTGAQDSFVLSGTYLANPQHHLYIAADKEEAAYLQNNIAALLEKKGIHFFPDSFKRPMDFEHLNSANVLQRTETINKISNIKSIGEIIVTYPEALFEKVVSPKVLNEKQISIVKDEKLDVDFLVELFVEYGFERVDFVYEPGQFSIRGGIVDIFSYGNEYPYRVELFDDEIESIRTFDPLTQLSVKKIARVSIIPNINTKFTQKQKTSLFKVLPENTVIWIKDLDMLIGRLEMCLEEAEKFGKTVSSLDEGDLAEIFRDRAFIKPDEVIQDIEEFALLFLNKNLHFEPNEKIIFNSKPQPNFNKNFKLLIENLHENQNAK